MPEVSRSLAPFLLGLVPLIAASNVACTRSVAVRTVEIKLTLLGTDPAANPYSDTTFKIGLAALLTNATGAAFEIDRIATTSVTYDPTLFGDVYNTDVAVTIDVRGDEQEAIQLSHAVKSLAEDIFGCWPCSIYSPIWSECQTCSCVARLRIVNGIVDSSWRRGSRGPSTS